MSRHPPIAVTGLHAADNPSPGIGVARCLRSAGHPVQGLCYSAIETGCHASEAFDRVDLLARPESGRETYFGRLAEVLEDSGARILIPTLEPEIVIFSRARRRLAEMGIRCLVPPPEVLRRTHKAHLVDLGRRCGFRVPTVRAANSLKEALRQARQIGLPLMIKGTWYEAHGVEHLDEIPALFRQLKKRWGLPVLLQPRALGSEAVVACLCDRPGHLARALSLRKLGMSDQGTTWCGVTFRNQDLLTACRRLLAEVEWIGPCEIEVLMDPLTGMLTLIEINGRFPSWIGIGPPSGSNLPHDLVRVLDGEDLGADPGHASGQAMVRQIVDRLVPMARLLQLDAGGSVHG